MIAILGRMFFPRTRNLLTAALCCRRAAGRAGLIASLLFSLTSEGLAAPENDGMYRLAIVLTSQQARTDLAQTLLAMIPRDDRPALMMNAQKAAEAIKEVEERGKDGRYHRNPQQYTLDLATELKVWPDGKSEGEVAILPTPEFFERFGARIASNPATAFPDVLVTPFPFKLKLPREAALTQAEALRAKDGDALTGQSQYVLCNPVQTLIDRAKCRVTVRQPTFGGEPVIELLQMGFRVETRKAMPLAVTAALINEIRAAVRAFRTTEMPASAFTAIPIPELGWTGTAQQREAASQVGTDTITALQQQAESRTDITAAEIEALWQRASGSVGEMTPPDSPSNWPAINLFDSAAKSDMSMVYRDWLAKLMGANLNPSGPGCELAPTLPSHTDAVASLLFPTFVKGVLAAQTSGLRVPARLPGAIRGLSHFLDPPIPTLVDIEMGTQPNIGLAVYSDISRGIGEDSDAARLTKILTDPASSRILIVSAATKVSVPNGYVAAFPSTPSNQQDPSTRAVIDSCKTGSFPSCLGMLPRVLVVAPVEQRSQYVLGASMVGIAAPGDGIPVVHDCGSAEPDANRWGKDRGSGSSFAAPIVTAVIAKIMGASASSEPASRDPLVAMMRVLATADPLSDAGSSQPSDDVTYGKLNASRALTGARAQDEGTEKFATVYFKDGSRQFLIVSPYPWANDSVNTDLDPNSDPGGPKRLGLWHKKRGVVRVTADDRARTQRPINLTSVLRIIRRPNPDEIGNSRFDVFFFETGTNIPSPRVKIITNARIGIIGADPGSPGYCSERNAGASFPACLYAWDGTDPRGFRPLDLTTVKDIVLSPNHFSANFVSDFDPINFSLALNPADINRDRPMTSPWRRAFCDTGIPRPVLSAIVSAQFGSAAISARSNNLLAAYGQYCSAQN